MGIEIERKFLLCNDDWREQVSSSHRMRQGYLQRSDQQAIRVRICDQQAHINIKHSEDGISRLEYEYPLPLADAQEMLERLALRPMIDKTRHEIRIGKHLWEIDEFHAENQGLIVAEIELAAPDEAFERPAWLGEEVSSDPRYFNSNLIVHPYSQW